MKGLTYLLAGRIFSVLFSLLSIRAITSFLSPVEVGVYYLITAIIMCFSFVLINPVGTYYNRHLHSWRDESKLKVSFVALNKYFLFCAFIVFPVLMLAKYFFNFADDLAFWPLSALVAFAVYFSSLFQTLTPTLNLFGLRKDFVFYTFIAQIIGFCLALFFVLVLSPKALSWFWGILIGQALTLFFLWNIFEKKFFEKSITPQKIFNSDMLRFSFPVMIATVFMWIQTQGYRIVVESTVGVEVLAFLGVALGLAAGASGAVESITAQYFHPDYFSELKHTEKKLRQNAWELLWKRTIGIYLPAMLYIACLSPFWLKLLTAAPYHSSTDVLKWGIFIELLRMLTNVLYLLSHSEKATKKSIFPYFVGALTLILGLVCLIYVRPEYLLHDLPPLIFLSVLSCFVVTYLAMRRLIRVSLNFEFIGRQLLYSLPFIACIFVLDNLGSIYQMGLATALTVYVLFLLKRHLKSIH